MSRYGDTTVVLPAGCPMNTDKQAQIEHHVRALAALLYEEAAPEQLTTLEGIEQTIRAQFQTHIGPEMAHFLSSKARARVAAAAAASKASSAS
ncbi:MAG: hypothetical protein AAFY57_02965 [Cyanobacteria bacterium J06642_2]